jgi:hypothetical protein
LRRLVAVRDEQLDVIDLQDPEHPPTLLDRR